MPVANWVRSAKVKRPRSPELGAVTAEFVILMPAVVLVLLIGSSVLALQEQRLALNQEVGLLARMIEAGFENSQIRERSAAAGISLEVKDSGDLTCLTGKKVGSVFGLGAFPISTSMCALAPGR